MATALQFAETFRAAKLAKIKVPKQNIVLCLFMLMIYVRFPIFLSLYWATNTIFSLLLDSAVSFWLSKKDDDYFVKINLKKKNNSRKKRGLPELSSLPYINN